MRVPPGLLLSLLSPYNRPALLQPARLSGDVSSAIMETVLRAVGRPMPALGVDIETRSCGWIGDGLFALRPFKEGELVTRYTGLRCSPMEYGVAFACGQTSGNYSVIIGGCIIDAENVARNVPGPLVGAGHLINHSTRRRNCEVKPINWLPSIDSFVLHITCTRPVAAGEEFLLDYGTGYWNYRFKGARRLSLQRLAVDWY